MTLVVDASVVVAALIDVGAEGQWAQEVLFSEPLAAPHLLPAECANVLRRAAASGSITDDVATLAHADLLDLPVRLVDYDVLGDRVWALRHNVSSYDAWYVALAEALSVDLATMDRRLVEATGPTCSFRTFPDAGVAS